MRTFLIGIILLFLIWLDRTVLLIIGKETEIGNLWFLSILFGIGIVMAFIQDIKEILK